MITIKQQEVPIEAEKGIADGFDFASCLFGTMKLNEIETFDVNLLSDYISILFSEGGRVTKYFPNVNGENLIIETLSFLESKKEVITNKEKYSRDYESKDLNEPFIELLEAKLTFDEYTADELKDCCSDSEQKLISVIVLNYIDFKKDFEANKIKKLLHAVYNSIPTAKRDI